MKTRPTSVTVIGVLLLVSSIFSLFVMLAVWGSSDYQRALERMLLPAEVQRVLSFLGLGVSGACAIGMLGGKRWGRTVLKIWGTIGGLVGIVNAPGFASIIGFLVFIVYMVILHSDRNNEYFDEQPE